MSTGKDAAIGVALIGALGTVIAAAIQAGVFSGGGSSGDVTGDRKKVVNEGPIIPSTRLPPVAPPSTEHVETSVFLDRDSGPAGTTVVVSGEGFLPNERVEIRLHTDRLARTRANASGRFSGVSVVVPDSFSVFAPQAFDMSAHGEQSLRSASSSFVVSG